MLEAVCVSGAVSEGNHIQLARFEKLKPPQSFRKLREPPGSGVVATKLVADWPSRVLLLHDREDHRIDAPLHHSPVSSIG